MHKHGSLEEYLKKYKYYKARMSFLEKCGKQIDTDTYLDFEDGSIHSSSGVNYMMTVKFFNVSEGSKTGIMREKSGEYGIRPEGQSDRADIHIRNELKMLKCLIDVIDYALDMLDGINGKYRIVLEKHYINNMRMDDVADSVHLSRSKCYELCREALKCMSNVVYGEMQPQIINK